MSVIADIKARMKHTTARLRKLERLRAALKGLQAKRRKQLANLHKPPTSGKNPPLTIFGVDYAWGSVPYDALKKAGVKYALRYISHDFAKDLDTIELKQLRRRKIMVGLVFESTAGRALQGKAAGAADARFARDRCNVLGLGDIPVFFAVDFDATDAQKPIIAEYLHGAAGVLGKQRVGVYGSYYVVRYMAQHEVCYWFWQTYAWSGGLVHDQAHVYQYRNGQYISGLSCDFNRARSLAWAR